MSFRNPRSLGVLEWELEVLAREILANASPSGQRGIESWTELARLMNGIKNVENAAYRGRIDASDVLFEFSRIAHRQFPWQAKLNQSDVARHFRLYNHTLVRGLVEQAFGMTTLELYQIGLSLAMSFSDAMTVPLPIRNEINHVSPTTIERFLDRFSATIAEHARSAREGQSYDINWAYNLNPLRSRPLIRTSDGRLALPITPFLLRRLMDGLYFDIVGLDGFGRAFGTSFQDYVGDVLAAGNRKGSLNLLAETKYGPKKRREDTVDWLALDESGVLFLECKVARMRVAGKIDLASRAALKAEVTKLAAYVVQTYATLHDARAGLYPNWRPDGRPIFPIVVTLDDWNVFGHHIDEMLTPQISVGLMAKGIDPVIMDIHPVQICPVADFETLIQVMGNHSIAHVMSRKIDGERRLWSFQAFIASELKAEWGECDQLFPSIWSELQQGALVP